MARKKRAVESSKRKRSSQKAPASRERSRSRYSRGRSQSNRRKKGASRRSLEQTSLKKKVTTGLLNGMFYVLTLSILIGAAFFSLSKDSEKAFFGHRFYTVLTNSMVPRDPVSQKGGFFAGDMIIVRMENPTNLEVGDIVTYDLMVSQGKDNAVLTHRLIEKLENYDETGELYFRTQGDANTASDRPISADQIIGKKVLVIPKAGLILSFLRENFLVSLGGLIGLFALIVSLRYYFSYTPSKDPLG